MSASKPEFQAFMIREFKKWGDETGQWRPSLIGWAKELGVGDASLDHWISGRRIPDLSSTILLARKLGSEVYVAIF